MLAQSTGQQLTCGVCCHIDAARVPVKACAEAPIRRETPPRLSNQGGGTVDHSLQAACAVDDRVSLHRNLSKCHSPSSPTRLSIPLCWRKDKKLWFRRPRISNTPRKCSTSMFMSCRLCRHLQILSKNDGDTAGTNHWKHRKRTINLRCTFALMCSLAPSVSQNTSRVTSTGRIARATISSCPSCTVVRHWNSSTLGKCLIHVNRLLACVLQLGQHASVFAVLSVRRRAVEVTSLPGLF